MQPRTYTSFILAIPRLQLHLRDDTWVVAGAPDVRLGIEVGEVGLTAALHRVSARGWVLESVLLRDSSPDVIVVVSAVADG